jgi:argininosuccinate lyase
MPQKKNPDFLELIRAKAGTNLGTLLSLFTTIKGLPFTYNRDLQEDRQGAIQTTKTVIESIKIMKEILREMKFNSEKMFQSAENSNILATDFADYLASKNIPFREAYNLMKEISNILKRTNKNITDLNLEDFQNISPVFTNDVMKITIKSSVEKRNSFGGTSSQSIKKQIKDSKNLLNKISNEIK